MRVSQSILAANIGRKLCIGCEFSSNKKTNGQHQQFISNGLRSP